MLFLLMGYDGDDAEAINRRMAVRGQHIALGDEMVASGKMLYGGAILGEDDKMIASVLVLDFADRAE